MNSHSFLLGMAEAKIERLEAENASLLSILKRIRDSYPGYIPDFVEAINAAIAKAERRRVDGDQYDRTHAGTVDC